MYCAEQFLSSIHRAAPIAIGVVVDRTFHTVNARMCELLGYQEKELVGKSARIVYPTQDEFERVGKEKYAMLAAKGIGTIETQWRAKDGRLIDILLSSTATDGRDISKGVTFTASDITLQKDAQRETEKLISSLGNVISHRTQWLNENNIRLDKEIKKRADIEKELRASKAKLEKTVKQLQKTQAQIIQTEKMASIGQLAAGVAHEINNPTAFVSSNLNTMSQYHADMARLLEDYEAVVGLLGKSKKLPDLPQAISYAIDQAKQTSEQIDLEFMREDFPELIEESKEGTERIKKIVEDLKDFAHPGDERCVETDINKGLDSTINIVWNEIKYTCKLTKDYGDLPPVWSYSQQINQVFMNLLINAAQAIDQNGLIHIKTRIRGEFVMVQISDNGRGIPDKILSKIFDPFFTTKDIGKGTGLGLSMAYSIIENHKGKIEVESKVGEGTTFTVYLPSTKDVAPENSSTRRHGDPVDK
jgi:PAS domain S-box-containing protein